ncbi:hypothetical protein [Paenibacillus pinihumi]|uniref:hypothetical protein n=1 Tax=Paenibacillus pinihumi TaxID=669462 RepID=UPI000490B1B3|nr:hypothetical protein [Paenibacillus pinihumi]
MNLSKLLNANGLTSGPVYATGIMKGWEVARMVADFKAQETIHSMTDRILKEGSDGADTASQASL